MRRVIVETDEGTRHEYSVPRSVHVNVQETERVRAGDPLIDGPIDPHDVLSVLGIKELQRYLVDKIQEVYRSQSVAINDKHIEVICRQMLRSVRVTRVVRAAAWAPEVLQRFLSLLFLAGLALARFAERTTGGIRPSFGRSANRFRFRSLKNSAPYSGLRSSFSLSFFI